MKDIDYDAILAGKIKQEGMDDDTFNEYMGYNKNFDHTELVLGIIFCVAVIIGACLFYQINKLICHSNAAQMGFECNYWMQN